LGLFIVRRLMQLTGGRVSASSEGLGRGAEFLLYWPSATEQP
jgi:signal transduction histidine kinase